VDLDTWRGGFCRWSYWQYSLCSNRAQPKQYNVSAGTRAPATRLKEKHAVEEEINRKAKRLEVQKGNIEQAVQTTQRIQKLKAVGLIGPPGEGKSTGSSSLEWNEEIHKALLVSV
jgi:ABC-type transport system involved in cytochrome bd biosynthesis fused ATPase/permease subunit